MSRQPFRTAGGGAIDRARPLAFRFDGTAYQGFAGDTLASALLANGVRLMGRSFKYHRPRGVIAAGSEEPNALVTLGVGARAEPNVRATTAELYEGLVAHAQNAWPSLGFDLGAVNGLIAPFIPAGFYYKTFIGGPKRAWTRLYEPVIRRMAGLGVAPGHGDADVYDKRHIHCDILIVGAGPAGLAAALAAAKSGASVLLVDEQAAPGGALRGSAAAIDGIAARTWAANAAHELDQAGNVRYLKRTTAFGRYDQGLVLAAERRGDHDPARGGPRQRLWQIRAAHIILATGAHEQPLVFGGNDRPGVMLASAAQLYARHYGVLAGKRVLVASTSGDAREAAASLAEAGAEIVALVSGDVLAPGDFPVIGDAAITRTFGRRSVRGAEIGTRGGAPRRIACDAILMSGGWQPALHLHSHVGGRTRYDAARGCFVAANSVDGVALAGSCAGHFSLDQCLVGGREAGLRAAGTAFSPAGSAFFGPSPAERTSPAAEATPPFRATPRGKAFIDYQNDVTIADIDLAGREGFVSVEHLKRYTTTGMATDQGKTSNLNALRRMAALRGVAPEMVGTTTFRPPYTPVSFGTLAGINIGALMDPVRRTPMHAWHEAAGAAFENVGQWKRPYFYPRAGETMDEAVRRECRAVRTAVGMFDASTLGKIDVRGPDAATFLDRVYANGFAKLAIGRCRYGLMLGDDGMVMDDGVTTRTGPERYLMTTTTGNAARVMEHLEDLLQTEWPELKVYLTSVTEHWAACVVTGPAARRLLGRVVGDVDLATAAFPHLSFREGRIDAVPVRLYRVSFTGELSYEVHVEAAHALAIWTRLFEAGEDLGVTAYGTEATHVLRAEKGYIIIGQESDGTATPFDLGLGWAVSKTKADFIGKRSLARPDTRRGDRKQLVGLLPVDRRSAIDEGAQLVASAAPALPAPMLGHVTSAYWSEALGQPFALALVARGQQRHGEIVHAWSRGRTTACEIVAPLFYDPEGARLDG